MKLIIFYFVDKPGRLIGGKAVSDVGERVLSNIVYSGGAVEAFSSSIMKNILQGVVYKSRESIFYRILQAHFVELLCTFNTYMKMFRIKIL